MIPLALFHRARSFLLARLLEPLEVFAAEILRAFVCVPLGGVHGEVQSVHLAVHRDGGVRLPVLRQETLGDVPLLRHHRQSGLDGVVMQTIAAPLGGDCGARVLRRRAQKSRLGDVANRRAASLRDEKLSIRQRGVAKLEPHRLCLRGELQRLEHLHGGVVVAVVEQRVELDERLVERVRHRVHPLVDDNLRLSLAPLDVLHLAADGKVRHPVRTLQAVPHAQVTAILSDDDVRVGDPLRVRAVREQRVSRLRLQVEEMELSLLIAKQEVRRPGVEFQPVDLVRMRECDLLGAFGTLAGDDEVGDSRGVRIHQVRNLFAILPAATLRLANANREQMRRDVTRSKRPNHLIHAVFDHGELPGVVYHAHAFSVEIERLGARAVPRHLTQSARLHIPEKERLRSARHQEPIFSDVNLGHVVAVVRSQDDSRAGGESFDNHRRPRHVRELEGVAVSLPSKTRIVHIHHTAQRSNGEFRSVRFPPERGDGVQVSDILSPGFLPSAPPRVSRKRVESVKRANHNRLAGGVKRRARKLSLVRISRVVEHRGRSMPFAAIVVEDDASIRPRRAHEPGAPRERVRDTAVRADPRAGAGGEREGQHRAVLVAAAHGVAVGIGGDGDSGGALVVCV